MNQWVLPRTAVAILILSAASALHAQAQAGNYSASEAGTLQRVLPTKPANGASYDVGDYPTFRPPLSPGEGSREVNVYCNVCHSPRYITMQPPLPAGAWADEVNKMVKTYGATVPEDVAQKIVAYLQSHYTPETRKH